MAVVYVLCSAALGIVPSALGGRSVDLSLYVSFFPTGVISLATPDGSAIGTVSGPPTVIPAGYYTLVFSGPGGCIALPNFHLSGPGVHLISNMTEAQGQKNPSGVVLEPSSTYTWFDDAIPAVVHTFTTSAQVEGSPPSPGVSGGATSIAGGTPVTSQDIVGSAIAPSRGTLSVALTATGKVRVVYHGKIVATLKAGKYKLAVTDRSSKSGLVLEKLPHTTRVVTAPAFTGKHSATVTLTAGKWLFSNGAAKTARTLVVH